METKKPKRYKGKNYAEGDICLGPTVTVAASQEWKDMLLDASQRLKVSMSRFVRVAVSEKMERAKIHG